MDNLQYRVAIVGSRRRNDDATRKSVQDTISALRLQHGTALVIVSGGCPKGADAFAKEYAIAQNIPYVEFQIDAQNTSAALYRDVKYLRNGYIASFANEVHGWITEERNGGTMDTVRRAVALHVDVTLHLPDGKTETVGKKERIERHQDWFT